MNRRSLCLLTAITLVIVYVAVPRPSQQPTIGSRDPYSTGVAERTGAPQAGVAERSSTATPSGTAEDAGSSPAPGTVAPQPTGGIGDPASYQKPTPKPRGGGIAGWATYYGSGQGYTGAINHRLGHVGQVAVVCGGAPFHCRSISIVDVCACGDRHGEPTLIDLSPFAFADFGPLSAGVIHISMEVLP